VDTARRSPPPSKPLAWNSQTANTCKRNGCHCGLIVSTVVAGAAAAKAGIVKGDILLSVDGTPVNSLADLTAAVNAAAPHHSAEFEMSRDGATRDVIIPL
jgi:S1-C subfamily serine protease